MQHMAPLVLPVPGGSVSLATGNLAISRNDLSVETSSGPFAVGATYNSADNTWRWSFDLTHDGHHFTDASGAWHDISHVGIGETIPGTRWVVVDGSTMRTKSGRTYAFEEGALASIHWWRNPERRVSVHREVIAGESRVTTIGGFTLEYSSAGNLERIVDRARPSSGVPVRRRGPVGRGARCPRHREGLAGYALRVHHPGEWPERSFFTDQQRRRAHRI